MSILVPIEIPWIGFILNLGDAFLLAGLLDGDFASPNAPDLIVFKYRGLFALYFIRFSVAFYMSLSLVNGHSRCSLITFYSSSVSHWVSLMMLPNVSLFDLTEFLGDFKLLYFLTILKDGEVSFAFSALRN